MSAAHINCMCLSQCGRLLFAGNKSGQIICLDPVTFEKHSINQAHLGVIQTLAAHPHRNIIASFARDNTVAVWQYDNSGSLALLYRRGLRGLGDGDYKHAASESQALALHPKTSQLAVRTACSGLVELDYGKHDNTAPVVFARPFPGYDVVTLAYTVDGETLLAGSNHGQIARLRSGEVIDRLTDTGFDEVVHWFEPLSPQRYIVANDSRALLVLAVDEQLSGRLLVPFAKDDLEHVTYSATSETIYASSFDRNIYEIDRENFEVCGTVTTLKFKIRWLKEIPGKGVDDGPQLIAQVRDGSLVAIDPQSGRTLRVFKETPPALWTAAIDQDNVLHLTGEGATLISGNLTCRQNSSRNNSIAYHSKAAAINGDTYTKRLAFHPFRNSLLLGRTDGTVIEILEGEVQSTWHLDGAVRDLSIDHDDGAIYAVTEPGSLHRLNVADKLPTILYQSSQPLWSLALDSKGRFVAVGERIGAVRILDRQSGNQVAETFSRLPKRMKWHGDSLLVTHSDVIDRITIDSKGNWHHQHELFKANENTAEDWVWDTLERYLLSITYNRKILLFDFATGELLDSLSFGMDYGKGIMMLPQLEEQSYPCDFIVYGRFDQILRFRIHDERIIPIGIDEVPL